MAASIIEDLSTTTWTLQNDHLNVRTVIYTCLALITFCYIHVKTQSIS